MKILQISKFEPTYQGGIEKLVKELSNNLSQQSIQNDILCFGENKKSQVIVKGKQKIYICRTLFSFFSAPVSLSIFFYLKKILHDYDIIHIHLPNPILAFYLRFIKLENHKITIHFHADVSRKLGYFLYRYYESFLLRNALKIIVTTHSLSQIETLKKYKRKFLIIPSYLNESDYAKADQNLIKKDFKNLASKEFICFVGRFSKYKNLPMLIRSFSKLKNNLKLYLIGNGKELKRVRSLIRELSLESRIKILNNIDNNEKRYFLNKALFTVLPSTTSAESYGYVQVESMAQGSPIISFDIKDSGVGEINKNQTGILLKVMKNIKDCENLLSEAINSLFEDRERLKFYSQNCLLESKKYSSEKIFKIYKELFLNL